MNQAKTCPPYAVLFKIHFWDDFAERQFRRLSSKVGSGDLFIIVDDTKGAVPNIQYDKVVRLSESLMQAEGYFLSRAGDLLWYNNDYPLYYFVDHFPEYDYVFMVEFDCIVSLDLSNIVRTMATEALDFVGEPVRTAPDQWNWTASARPYYPDTLTFHGRLACFSVFSRSFALHLRAERVRQAGRAIQMLAAGEELTWPLAEAFVGAEIAQSGASTAPLSAFGDVSGYDWAPAIPEFALPALANCAILHPVLDPDRCLNSLNRHWPPSDLFQPASPLATHLARFDRTGVASMYLPYFVVREDFAAIEQLRLYAAQKSGGVSADKFNVALNKPTTQSSTSSWSRHPTPSKDSSGAVSGSVDGRYGFHTSLEDNPWWCVDLGAIYPVRQIRIHNRLDAPSRSHDLTLSASIDLLDWRLLFRNDCPELSEKRLDINFENRINMRFVRIHLPRMDILHLDEVEVYV